VRKAARIVAAVLGFLAGLAGLEHGISEILQGNAQPVGLMFPSMGPPCNPAQAWNACEPAVSVVPNFLVAGTLTVLLSLALLLWSAAFIQHPRSGTALILLSVALLAFGGGVFPPLLGIAGGVAGTQIHKPLAGKPGAITRLAAKLWPWPLVILIVWLLGQFPLGYFFNDLLKSIIVWGLLLIVVSLPLSIWVGYAHDAAS
jgi:hypothetical protein